MGTEYYLLKPEKRELFYLGKHFNGFNGISSRMYRKSIYEATYPNYEDWDEFFWDTLRENWDYFLRCELTLEQTSDVIYKIYDWCKSDKVILDNDCSISVEVWKDWKETGDITKILEDIHNKTCNNRDENSYLNEYLEEQQSTIFKDPPYSSAIIGVTTDGRAVYDQELMIKELCEKNNISYEEALEFIEYNIIGSLSQPDSKYPTIVYKKEDLQ